MFSLHKIPVSVLCFFLSLTASAGDPYLPTAGASEAGMSYTCVMKPGFWSAFQNQALLCDNRALSFGINYVNRFNISELGARTAGLVIPAGKATLGAVYTNSGFKDFMRHSAGLACGMNLSEKLSAGVQIDYYAEVSPGDYGNRHILAFETGVVFRPSENIRIGLHLFNPIPGSLRKSCFPSSIRTGAGISLSEFLFVAAEVEINTESGLAFKSGIEYKTGNSFRVRGGFSSENTSFSFGMGYKVKVGTIDLGFVSHDRLGITSSASLIFEIR